MHVDWTQILVHAIHVLAAVVAIGGAIFLRYVLMPSAQASLEQTQHDALRSQLLHRWKIVIMICITALLVTGLWNFLAWSGAKAKTAPGYHAIFGIKVLLAFGVFFIASALTGRAEVFAPMRAKAKLWLNISAALGVATILLASILSRMG